MEITSLLMGTWDFIGTTGKPQIPQILLLGFVRGVFDSLLDRQGTEPA
jgi:hypothetical protein